MAEVLPPFVALEAGQLAAGFAGGEVWLLDLVSGKRGKLGEAGGVHGKSSVAVEACLGGLVLAGDKRGLKNALQVFDARRLLAYWRRRPEDGEGEDDDGEDDGKEDELIARCALPLEVGAKHKGLAAVESVDATRALLACGRGVGRAHVWALEMGDGASAPRLKHVGSVNPKSHTIVLMRFVDKGRALLTVNDEKVAELWHLGEGATPFQLGAGQSLTVPWEVDSLARALRVDEATAQAFMDGFESALRGSVGAEEWVAENGGEPWTRLFPPRLLDPTAYDGEVDAEGLPHGYGTKALEDDPDVVYEGEWRHGKRHGRGLVSDARNDKVLYSGGWRDGKRHGFGRELRTNGESYAGEWRNGLRDGLGSLHMAAGIKYVGFFRQGEKHGLGWWTWLPGCPLVPYARSPEDIAPLGAIRCIAQFRRGKFFSEFHFHRVDGEPISEEQQALFNLQGAGKFSGTPDGHWTGSECWACMEEAGPPGWAVCANERCRMRVHLACLSTQARRRARARQRFVCPLPECQRWKSEQNPRPKVRLADYGVDGPVYYVDAHGLEVRIETDSDLEEALEEADLCGTSTVRLFLKREKTTDTSTVPAT